MFEATTNPAARNAIENAHMARGAAMASILNWLFHPSFR